MEDDNKITSLENCLKKLYGLYGINDTNTITSDLSLVYQQSLDYARLGKVNYFQCQGCDYFRSLDMSANNVHGYCTNQPILRDLEMVDSTPDIKLHSGDRW